MKEAIDVMVRVRPTAKFAHDSIFIDEAHGEITVKKPRNKEEGHVNHQQDTWNYRFGKIFLNETQASFFDKTIAPLIPDSLRGINAAIIAYGQTGAGKTFTISGSHEDSKYRGILPRMLTSLFHQINFLTAYFFKIKMTYIEIHNEIIRDLLVNEARNTIVLQEDSELGVFPQGALMVAIRNEEEALFHMFRGENNKSMSEHKLNKNSSRSHTIFTLYIESRLKSESESKISFSKFSIFDLAGCERTKKTNSEGLKMLEASFINKSLSSLEQLVVAYNHKSRDFLPYRQTKLTYLLKDSIGGNAKTVFIANIWPEENYIEETISALRFASRMSDISNFVQKNTKSDTAILLKNYEQQVNDLKKELAMHDAFTERKGINYDFLTPDDQQEQKKLAEKFLNGQIEDIEIKNLRQVKELFSQFKILYTAKAAEKNLETKSSSQQQNRPKHFIQEANKNKEEIKRVGKEDIRFGFGLGQTNLQSRPPHTNLENENIVPKADKSSIVPLLDQQYGSQELSDSLEELIKVEHGKGAKNYLFAIFKETYAKNLVDDITSVVKQLQELRSQIDVLKNRCNSAKSKIETLQSFLKASYHKSSDDGSDKTIFEELKLLKHKYAEDLKQHKVLKLQNSELQNLLYLQKKKMLDEFNAFSFKLNLKNTNKENLTPDLASIHRKEEKEAEDGILFERARLTYTNTVKALAAEKFISSISK